MSFPAAARTALADAQLRRNLGKATTAIREKRARAVGELDDWEALRDAGAAIKARTMTTLPELLSRLEDRVAAAGGTVHWARDGAEANAIVARIAREHGADEVIKVKSLASDEIGLNEALALRGIAAIETDLAELIVQLGDDEQSHILVPAIHRNRAEIAALFERTIAPGEELGLEPTRIAEAARRHLREKFLSVPVAVSGANFGIAETGSIGVVESEGNGRMCTTLPKVLITLMGIEKVLPEWRDLEVMLQLLPRSSTAERMNPYTSIWTGVREDDGPREFHLVLLDAGRTQVLADEVGRQALHCIRCSACLNSCPVYSRTGGHAYESVYPGPIGAILTPQLQGLERAPTLPWASSLCGACYEVCPVKIDIPQVLVHLRTRVVREVKSRWSPERLAMDALSRAFRSRAAYERAQRLARVGNGPIAHLPGPLSGWTAMRELPEVPRQSFREWWTTRAAAPRGAIDPADTAGRSHGGAPTDASSPATDPSSRARDASSPATDAASPADTADGP
jgi:L-lactate dehydrogenase complex protein LldF